MIKYATHVARRVQSKIHTHLEEEVAQVVDDHVLFLVLRGVPPIADTRPKSKRQNETIRKPRENKNTAVQTSENLTKAGS